MIESLESRIAPAATFLSPTLDRFQPARRRHPEEREDRGRLRPQGRRRHARSPRASLEIASVVIGGHVIGEAGDLSKSFGFGAEEIGSFQVNGVALPLKPGRNNDISTNSGSAGDMVPVGSSRAFPGTVSDGFAVHVFEI